jgi:hypothetical protein
MRRRLNHRKTFYHRGPRRRARNAPPHHCRRRGRYSPHRMPHGCRHPTARRPAIRGRSGRKPRGRQHPRFSRSPMASCQPPCRRKAFSAKPHGWPVWFGTREALQKPWAWNRPAPQTANGPPPSPPPAPPPCSPPQPPASQPTIRPRTLTERLSRRIVNAHTMRASSAASRATRSRWRSSKQYMQVAVDPRVKPEDDGVCGNGRQNQHRRVRT